MQQQAKLFAPRQHLGAKAGCHAKQSDADRHGLQPVGDREAAVKNIHGAAANFLRGAEFQQAGGRVFYGCGLVHRRRRAIGKRV